MDNCRRGTLEMMGAMVISGTIGWFVVQVGQPAISVVFWRCLFGALAMLAVCAAMGMLRRDLVNGRQAMLLLLGGLALVTTWGLLFAAYQYVSISIATVLFNTQPFMLVALSMVIFGERLTADKLGWLMLAFAGLIAIVVAGSQTGSVGDSFLPGVVISLAAAFFYALTAILGKGLKGVPPHLIVLVQLSLGAVILLPFAEMPSGGHSWGLLATIGVIHTGLMSTLYYGALHRIPASYVGVLAFIYPVVTIIVDWLAFDRQMNAIQISGAAAILFAALAMNYGLFARRAEQGTDQDLKTGLAGQHPGLDTVHKP